MIRRTGIYGHMQSENSKIVEICPITGEQIEMKTPSKRMVVKRYLLITKSPPRPLCFYKEIGIKGMTEEQIESAYDIIKRITSCKIV